MWRGPEREAASPWQPCKDPAGDKNGLPTLISLSQTSSWCSLPLASLSQELEGKGSPLAQPQKARARGQLDRMQRAPRGRGMQHPIIEPILEGRELAQQGHGQAAPSQTSKLTRIGQHRT